MSLHNRILVLFLVLLLVVLGVTLVTVSQATYRHTLDRAEDELAHGQRILVDKLRSRQRSLLESGSTLVKDGALRQAIFAGVEDHDSLLVALDNHRKRTSADFAFLVGLDGTILADTLDASRRGSRFPFEELLVEGPATDPELRIVALDDHVVQLVSVPYYVPVSAPQPSLWLALGSSVDRAFVGELSGLLGVEAAVAARRTTGDAAIVSSLPGDLHRELAESWPGTFDGVEVAKLAADRYLMTVLPIPVSGGASVVGVLMLPTQDALLDYRNLSARFIGIAVTAAFLALVGALLLARGITRPIRTLADAARRIAAGDYSAELPTAERGEVGRLAREVGTMQREVQEREEAIQLLAFSDDLTGLPNRNRFRAELGARISQARRTQSRLAVAMVDLDRFRDINDALGHHVGDRLLTEVASRLRAAAEGLDILVARLGGDEFGLILPVAGISEAKSLVDNLRRALAGAIEIDDLHLNIEASAGIALFPDLANEAQTLLRQAEVAMYAAKERRIGVAFYDASLDRQSLERLSLMGDLRRALEEDELELCFQPKQEISTGATDKVEVLLRWTHPQLGPVSPGDFIPIAEQTGFIREITAWVLRRALEQVGQWQRQGMGVKAAVNISAFDLHDSNLPNRVRKLLAETEVPPDLLGLEVTESGVMADPETALAVLEQLASMGVTLSIDDFGTGYSSLAQLRRLPVHEIKIDRSFVSQMMDSEEVAKIVRSTVELGHGLGLEVVAEGVESAATLESLRFMGCDLAQGYFISKPLSAADLIAWRKRVPAAAPRSLAGA